MVIRRRGSSWVASKLIHGQGVPPVPGARGLNDAHATIRGRDTMQRAGRAACAALMGVLVCVGGCRGSDATSAADSRLTRADDGPGHESRSQGPWFTDEAAVAGLAFTHVNAMSGRFEIQEILPPGCALFDYDNDGDLDVLLLQERPRTASAETNVTQGTDRDGTLASSRLFRNDLEIRADGTRVLRFTDVTRESRIDIPGWAMGVAAGDIDNDGCTDLYITHFGPNQLLKNSCDGTFTDVSKRSGTDDDGWAISASFVDFDRDGWLDLYVGNYVHYDPRSGTQCHTASGALDYCTPQAFRYQPDRLFHNERNGTFVDVSRTALMGAPAAPALGVSTADFDGDGWIDIYVANDGEPNHLWRNQRDGTFRNVALLSGVAVSAEGKPEGSMGVDAGDVDDDGDEDLFMTHLPDQGNNLYVNDGAGSFEDASVRARLGPPSLGFTGFGTAWLDVDNDGRLDLLAVNGAVAIGPKRAAGTFPYDERKLLFKNTGDGRFDNVSARGGPAFETSDVSRGAAFGDIDNDGDIDVLVANNNGPARLLVNRVGNGRRWIGLKLVGRAGGRDMLGARVAIERDGVTLWRRARSDGSYASANDPRVLAGLGDNPLIRRVRVVWPSGRTEHWSDLTSDRWFTLEEGTGQ